MAIINYIKLNRTLWSKVRYDAVCSWCGGDIEVEEELEAAGEVAQCIVCLKWNFIDGKTPTKLVK